MNTQAKSATLKVGCKIRGYAADSRVGTLGAIVARINDRTLYGLTAAHVVVSEGYTQEGFRIGTRASLPDRELDTPMGYFPISTAVAFVRLERIAVLGAALLGSESADVADPLTLLGSQVVKPSFGSAGGRGTLSGVHCPMHL